MTRTPQQFDGLTLEEREQYLERRDREERAQAVGFALSAESSAAHREFWMREAQSMVKREPALIWNIAQLAAGVSNCCNENGITKPKGGTPYKRKTIYNYLTEHRARLLECLAGNVPASVDSESRAK